jgi:hypothetical protein
LSGDRWYPHLERQIAATSAIMRVADDWPGFKRMFRRAFPRVGDQPDMLPDPHRPDEDKTPLRGGVFYNRRSPTEAALIHLAKLSL